VPMLIQFPIWIALYDVIRSALGNTPESLIDLAGRLYPWAYIQQAVPLSSHFLLWDMSKPDQTFAMPVLVGVSMYLQQKLTMPAGAAAANTSQAQTNQMLLWMMPLMFGWITLTVPSGLALYWLISNIVGVAMNYYIFGWQGTSWRSIVFSSSTAATGRGAGLASSGSREHGRTNSASPAPTDGNEPPSSDGTQAGKRDIGNDRKRRSRGKRKDGRGSDRQSA
jgi:YidC/Oxa1 family membrane protein insertase